MCMNPFAAPKPAKPQVIQSPGSDPQTLEQIERDRDDLNRQRDQLLADQRSFNEDQRRFQQEARTQQAQPVIVPTVERRQSAAATGSERTDQEASLQSRRRGRRTLRIPLGTTTAGAGGTGLNIPQG